MKKILFLLFLISASLISLAQIITNVQTACTTTGQNTLGNFNISYTIGEMPLISTQSSNGLIITQGILQPTNSIADTIYECYSQTEVTICPNPNPGVFSLRLSLFKKGNASIRMYDMMGKQLLQDEFVYNTFLTKQYNISKYANGQYYLQLFFTENGTTKPKKCVYTIQKIN
ncbi:MAG: T9SS type A sorting domain-containing protein [Ferruginibacter sp.]|nr:T9SS type A sorting domain-containing protein [Ferruginibacter sp.]